MFAEGIATSPTRMIAYTRATFLKRLWQLVECLHRLLPLILRLRVDGKLLLIRVDVLARKPAPSTKESTKQAESHIQRNLINEEMREGIKQASKILDPARRHQLPDPIRPIGVRRLL